MGRLASIVAVFVLALGFGAASARAEDAGNKDAAWQAAITGQIEAFRHKDAPGAFAYASAPFHESFPDAATFFLAIVGSGYAPIMDSVTHSFGPYEMQPSGVDVIQLVRLVGPDQQLYQALYSLTREAEGWRVTGVVLSRQAGVGV